jgi:hypothetical protein
VSPELEFRLLGPLEVTADGREIAVGAGTLIAPLLAGFVGFLADRAAGAHRPNTPWSAHFAVT